MFSDSEILATKLEAVLEGRLRLEEVLEEFITVRGAASNCYHGLQHFLVDADIRANDPEYKEMQESEMRALISLLKAGADGDTLAKISFLGKSEFTLWMGV